MSYRQCLLVRSGSLSPRQGFTLMELLLVMAVIAALAAMGFPIWNKLNSDSKKGTTKVLVQAVATAISGYSTQFWTVVDSTTGKPRIGRIWDLNSSGADMMKGDGIIDGRPPVLPSTNPDKTHDGPFWDEVIKSGYTGFVDMVRPPIAKNQINAQGQVIDSWGEPLHIAFAIDTYGASWFGVWSKGPDKKSDKTVPDTLKDDITSWKNTDD